MAQSVHRGRRANGGRVVARSAWEGRMGAQVHEHRLADPSREALDPDRARAREEVEMARRVPEDAARVQHREESRAHTRHHRAHVHLGGDDAPPACRTAGDHQPLQLTHLPGSHGQACKYQHALAAQALFPSPRPPLASLTAFAGGGRVSPDPPCPEPSPRSCRRHARRCAGRAVISVRCPLPCGCAVVL